MAMQAADASIELRKEEVGRALVEAYLSNGHKLAEIIPNEEENFKAATLWYQLLKCVDDKDPNGLQAFVLQHLPELTIAFKAAPAVTASTLAQKTAAAALATDSKDSKKN